MQNGKLYNYLTQIISTGLFNTLSQPVFQTQVYSREYTILRLSFDIPKPSSACFLSATGQTISQDGYVKAKVRNYSVRHVAPRSAGIGTCTALTLTVNVQRQTVFKLFVKLVLCPPFFSSSKPCSHICYFHKLQKVNQGHDLHTQ